MLYYYVNKRGRLIKQVETHNKILYLGHLKFIAIHEENIYGS